MNRFMNPLVMPPSESEPSQSWSIQIKAILTDEAARVTKLLTGAILATGGWVLSRGANDAGVVNMLFEFERQQCLEIYTMLIVAGLDLSPLGHLKLTELCQCTRNHFGDCRAEIVSVDLEINAYPAEIPQVSQGTNETL